MSVNNIAGIQTPNIAQLNSVFENVRNQILQKENIFQASENASTPSSVISTDDESILNEVSNAQEAQSTMLYENDFENDYIYDLSDDTVNPYSLIIQARTGVKATKGTKPDMTLQEFLDNAPNNQVRKMYRRLFEKYDYNTFYNLSDVPRIFQTVYGNKFSTGTIQSAGCGITSLSMIESYMTGEDITPDMLTGGYMGDNPASAMEKGFKKLGFEVERYQGQAAIDNLDAALEQGPIIARVGRASKFTDAGHFIVITGKTKDGKYIVNDPNIENYYKSHMIDGFTNGFDLKDVTRGLKGIYILSK